MMYVSPFVWLHPILVFSWAATPAIVVQHISATIWILIFIFYLLFTFYIQVMVRYVRDYFLLGLLLYCFSRGTYGIKSEVVHMKPGLSSPFGVGLVPLLLVGHCQFRKSVPRQNTPICSPTFLFSPFFVLLLVFVCLCLCSHLLGYSVYILYPHWWVRCLWSTVGDEVVLGMVLGAVL